MNIGAPTADVTTEVPPAVLIGVDEVSDGDGVAPAVAPNMNPDCDGF